MPAHAHVLPLYTKQHVPLLCAVLRPRQPAVPPVGGSDVAPPGMRPPGVPDLPGMGGPLGGGGLPGVSGGGMHVGPNDPLFAGRFGGGRGRMGGGGGLPPGARWDPIGPPGMQVCPVPGCLCTLLKQPI